MADGTRIEAGEHEAPEVTGARRLDRKTPVASAGRHGVKNRGRAAPLAYGALSFILIITVVAAAYSTSAPGLSIAEFAPSAQNPIDQTPSTQGGSNASGRGGRGSTTTSPLGVTTVPPDGRPEDSDGTPTSLVGRGRNCYGNPPRQAEDPSSPPCIATMFEGDNGGATSMGVSESEVRIAFPVGSGAFEKQARMLTDWFNQRYEFYGRKLVPVIFPAAWFTDPNGARAAAAEMATSNIFGGIDMFRGVPPSYHSAMARAKIITVAVGYESLLDDKTTYDQLHPYIWGVYPSAEQNWRALSSFVCTSLAGKPARHAPDFAQTTRKFGIISYGQYRTPYIDPLVSGLSACGADPQVVKIDIASGDSGQKVRNAATAFKSAGVTSVICACVDSNAIWGVANPMGEAGFKPEILHPLFSFGPGDEENIMQWAEPELQNRVFGITPTQHIQPYQAYPWFPLHFALTPAGSSDGNDHDPRVMEVMYRQVQVLAAGIQMAGPNLTPETFAAGLMSSQFPNFGAGAPPVYQPTVGFGPGDHTFYSDYAITWWGPEADAYQWQGRTNKGSWCYLDRGKRWNAGSFPADADARINAPGEPCR